MDDEEIVELSEEQIQKIERVKQAETNRLNAEAHFESQKKWRTVFERAPKETIPFIIYVVYDVGMALMVLFVLMQYTDVRLWIGALLLFIAMVAPLSVLPHKGWKGFFRYLKSKLMKGEKSVKPQFEMYKDTANEYRWRLRAPNGQIIAVSGEGYEQKQGCENGIKSIRENIPEVIIQDLTEKDSS